MKKSIKIFNTFLILMAGLLLFACNKGEKKSEKVSETDNKEQVEVKSEDLPGTSVFHLDNTWKNQEGESMKLKDLYGKPTVMAMIYTHCPYACPRLIGDMKEIEKKLPEKYLDDINFLLVSIDPEQDTPDTLRVFMKEKNLDTERWTGIVSEKSDIQDLAAAIGFNYKKTSAMDFAHSNLITVFDSKGRQIHQTEGFNAAKDEMIDKLIQAVEERKKPS